MLRQFSNTGTRGRAERVRPANVTYHVYEMRIFTIFPYPSLYFRYRQTAYAQHMSGIGLVGVGSDTPAKTR